MRALTFNAIPHTDFPGLSVRSGDRSIKAPINNRRVDIPGKDGSYIFPGDKKDKNKTFIFTLIAASYEDLWAVFNDVSSWLSVKTKCPLVTDDRPGLIDNALVEDEIIPTLSKGSPMAEFTVLFKCDPYSYFNDIVANITMDSELPINCTLGLEDVFDFTIAGPQTIAVNNFGTAELSPIILVTGSFTTLSITVNGKTFNYNEAVANKTLTIDNGRRDVTLEGVNKNAKWSGSTITLAVGINQITIAGTGLNCVVSFGQMVPLFS
jgi:phage-related protein